MKLQPDALSRVDDSFRGVKLGDKRLEARAAIIARSIAKDPQASLPMAMVDAASLEATYRFVNNPRVRPAALMDALASNVLRLSTDHKTVLALHDTTTIKPAVASAEEVGYLNTGNAGFFVHFSLVVSTEQWRRPLGVTFADVMSRPAPSAARGKKKSSKATGAQTAKWKNRESERWLSGIETTEEYVECDVIHVADREADSYALMARLQANKHRFIFRLSHDRRARLADSETGWDKVKNLSDPLSLAITREIEIGHRKGRSIPRMRKDHPARKGRLTELKITACKVELAAPKYLLGDHEATLHLNMVHVQEPKCPSGEVPVEWMLLTTESIATAAEIEQVVDHYRARWTIEEFNKALKTGCAYELRQFESGHALRNILMLTLPTVVEILWLRSRARTEPEAPAEEVVGPTQLDVLRHFSSRPPPATGATVTHTLDAVAALGGHKRSNGDAGWHVLYRGWTKLQTLTEAWVAAKMHGRAREAESG